MKSDRLKNKLLRIGAILMLLLIGINALVAGYLFIIDPTGHKMGIELSYLQNAPFETYLIPGLILFIVIGCLSMFTAVCVWKKTENHPYWIMLQSSLLSGWILIQIILVQDFNWLHALMLLISALLWRCAELMLKNHAAGNF
ncbi:MAG: hypothetical protein JST78_08715 [Bacteroidetes bacterium]|nr:hypothetical protein [Bacteroidota bacterium]